MSEVKTKRCPRCNLKMDENQIVCQQCGLNFDKLKIATNAEGKRAISKGEYERVVWTKTLPNDLNKWKLLLMTILAGFFGVHLWYVGKMKRAIAHSIGIVCAMIYMFIFNIETNIFLYNLGNLLGAFWVVTFVLVFIDIFDIIFNSFKVPVSLPYKED